MSHDVPVPSGPGRGAGLSAVTRRDPDGRSISLDHTPPSGSSVLFTGAPGMGKTVELDRAQAHARLHGWTVLRVDASPREPLENRVVRAVTDQLGPLRKAHGFRAVRNLRKLLRALTPRPGDAQHGAELRFGVAPVQAVVKRQWAAPDRSAPGATFNELADRLGDLAAKQGRPAVLMVDNVDVASERDLAAINELAAHLERSARPVFLVVAGGEQATTRLMNASRGLSGVETDISRRYDVRECRPMTDDELRPALTSRLAREEVLAEPAAVEELLQSANGSPRRLVALSDEACRLARAPSGLTADLAATAIDHVNSRSRLYYEAAWNNCSAAELTLLAQAAGRGQRGLSMPAVIQAAGLDKLPALDSARQSLKARGLLRESEAGRVKFADPGLQQWVRAHVGPAAPHGSVSVQAVLASGRSAGEQPQQASRLTAPRRSAGYSR